MIYDRVSKNTLESRQGENKGRIYILAASLVLIILFFGSVYGYTMLFAHHQ